MRILNVIIVLLWFCISLQAREQQTEKSKKEAPGFKVLRAEEHYAYLKEKDESPYEKDVFDAIKYISLDSSKDIYLSFGGQYRPRFEHYSNRFWSEERDQNFYSQRFALYTNAVFGKYARLFGELYHGYTSHEKEFAENDQLDLFQAFAEFKVDFASNNIMSIRFGRQEMGLGSARLVGIREGPNIRRSYDMARIIFNRDKTKLQAFYGKEVRPLFDAFDNVFSLFDNEATNPKLWGVYTQFVINGLNGLNEIYYLGFQADNSTFNDVKGDETRHTIGIRRSGKIGNHWKYNSEVIYQFGEIGDDAISAFSIDTDWHYELLHTKWKWSPGLKLEYTSGDGEKGDGKINSFNPMFVNPAFYSLAATVTPINIIGVHPSVSFHPQKRIKLYVEWAIFWRASKHDGLYRPTRFISRAGNDSESAGIGHQYGAKVGYEVNRHFSIDFDLSYFIAGDYLEDSGEAENIFHIAPTLNYRF
ncbi:MAG: alginate export family protein [Bacteroidota bacterium]